MNKPKQVLSFPFPYAPPWPIQQNFMSALYYCIEAKHVGVFESPTGTVSHLNLELHPKQSTQGKSLSIISGALKWLTDHNAVSSAEQLAALIQQKMEAQAWAISRTQQSRQRFRTDVGS
ncbi:DEAD H (Asp-Glu-Ala-Asp His) box helicase 11 [Physocladia obscura]|uniref:DEAD H (Asp-Glu-Ala-Asp His) box helicase 11 n=1 Tax=Physocladia obscura TaxID=109957 RepID=A0AAD5SSP1_9FUNG|nr:DEAD H (Asp-Glu-Ala-Asp His) box helicase 11 [Physocladia obscura]